MKKRLVKKHLTSSKKMVSLYSTKEGGTNNGCFGGTCCPSKAQCC